MLLPSARIVALLRALLGRPATAVSGDGSGRPGSGQPGASAIERVIVAVAAVVCLLFVGVLRDTPDGRFELPTTHGSVPAPLGDGACQVHVVDEEGRPHPEAMVRLFFVGEDGQVYFAGEKLAVGAPADFAQLPRGELWVLAYGRGRERASTRVMLGSTPVVVTLALRPAETLSVRVVDDAGSPLAGIDVAVVGTDPLPHLARTDPEGRVLLDRLGAAPWSVTAVADGFDPVTRSGVYPGPALEIRLERLGGFAVTVIDIDGEPAPFAEVLVSGPGIWPARSTITDGLGQASIVGLYGGVYDLRARFGDRISTTDFSVPLPKGQMVERTLQLEEGRYVTVRVTDGPPRDGRPEPPPVALADVILVEEGLSAFPVQGRTNPEGLAIMGPISRGPATVTARAEGFMPRIAAVGDSDDDDVTIPLLRGGTIVGDVRDERGFVVDGATIEVIGTDTDGMPIHQTTNRADLQAALFAFSLGGPLPLIPKGELGVMPGPVPPIPHAGGAGDPSSALEAGEPWVSANDGTFRLSPVSPGRVQLLVRHPEYIEQLSEIVSLGPGEEREIKVVLTRGGRLEGRVTEEDRTPVVGARIEIAAFEGTFEQLSYTDEDGRFAAAAVPKSVLVTVYRAEALGEVAARVALDLDLSRTERIEIVLPKLRELTTLRIVDRDGFPLSGVETRVLSLDLDASLARTFFSNDDGEVAVPSARGLPLRVVLEKPSKAPLVEEIAAADREHKLIMQDGLTLRGRVTAREGRDRLEAADVTIFALGGTEHASTDVDGFFTVDDLAAGRLRLVARHPDYAKASRVIWFEGDARRPIEIEAIDLSAAGSVSGKVLDELGDPVVGARVGIDSVPTFLPVGRLPSGLALTDADGHFNLGQVPEGAVTLEAYSAELGRIKVENIRVVAGRMTDRIEIKIPDQGYDPRKLRAAGSVAMTLAERGGRVVVLDVPEGGEAEHAGLEPEDVLISVNGRETSSLEVARDALGGPLGQDVIVEFSRNLPNGSPLRSRLRIRREAVRR